AGEASSRDARVIPGGSGANVRSEFPPLHAGDEATAARRPLELLAVGRLVPQKGFDLLLEALAGTTRDVKLTIAGEGPEHPRLEHAASKLPAGKPVRFVGFTDNPWRLMARSDVLVLSSRYEGLPNVVLEAGAVGLPVIAFDCPGGTREIVYDGQNGVLVPCGNTDALTRAIDHFDREWFDADTIRKRIHREHHPETIVRAYERLLESVAG
ncbi:MAG: glycosyltransferase, partial [Spirochaetales bacterium]